MAYKKTFWKDRIVEKPNTYRKVENTDGTITLYPITGQVIEKGTPISAANLNKIENGIVEVYEHLDTIANKGTTVEVLERVTKEEIERQIADGTIANMTLDNETKSILNYVKSDMDYVIEWESGKYNTNGFVQTDKKAIRTAKLLKVREGDIFEVLESGYNCLIIRYNSNEVSSSTKVSYTTLTSANKYTFTEEDAGLFIGIHIIPTGDFISIFESSKRIRIYTPPLIKPLKQEELIPKMFSPDHIRGLNVGRNKFPNYDYESIPEEGNAAGSIKFNRISKFFGLKPNIIYTNNTNQLTFNAIKIYCYNANYDQLTSVQLLGGGKGSFTTPEGTVWGKIKFHDTALDSVQLTEGTDKYTDYRPWEVLVDEKIDWDSTEPTEPFILETNETVTTIKNGDMGKLRYLVVSDIHAGTNGLDKVKAMGLKSMISVAKQISADFILLLGDLINGAVGTTAESWKVTLAQFADIFADCHIPVIVSRGNHDDNTVGGPTKEKAILNTWWTNNMDKCISKSNNKYVTNADRSYGYYNIFDKKIRLVNINCSDLTDAERLTTGGQNLLKISQEQLTWLDTDAFVVDEGWKIICCSHMTPINAMAVGSGIKNNTDLFNLLDKHKDKIIAFNFGHIHFNCTHTASNNIIYLGQVASGGGLRDASIYAPVGYGMSSPSPASAKAYRTGTFCFDICIIKEDNTIRRVRWGVKDDTFASN